MIPNDLKKLTPKVLQDNMDDSGQALIDLLNNYMSTWKSETLGIQDFKISEKCPNEFLDELGYYLAAGIFNTDTETEKRKKIYYAVKRHKFRTTWNDDVKGRIKDITGITPYLIQIRDEDDYIFTGDGLTPAGYYWSTFGVDGIDDDLGCLFSGSAYEVEIAGVVWIDLKFTDDDVLCFEDNDSIITGDGVIGGTTYYSSIGADGIDTDLGTFIPFDGEKIYKDAIIAILKKLVLDLQDHVPAYFRVFLGYYNKDNIFTILEEV